MEVLSVLLTATALSAAAGFRAFLPLLGLALAQRTGLALPMAEEFAWVASDRALIVLAVAATLEVAADKVPVVDNLLDTVGLFVRPLAGGTAAMAATSDLGTGASVAMGLAALVLSGGVASAKAAERGASTATTAGLANPVLSVRDDVLAGGTILAGLLAPLLVIPILYLLYRLVRFGLKRLGAVRARFQRSGKRPRSVSR